MSVPTDRWKEWEGRLVDEKFPLRRWLGSSDHSAAFVTDRVGSSPQQNVIKVIAAQNLDAKSQLSLWAEVAKLLHVHLIRLLAFGCCTIDDTPLLYVVMEYAEENLAEIMPVRPLSGDEALDMLRPAAEALAFLHGSGFVHCRIKPSNIMAVGDQLKLSSDGLRKQGQARRTIPVNGYDAPEVAISGSAPASDIWSLGATLVSVLEQKEPTENEPKTYRTDRMHIAAQPTVPEDLRRIVPMCLQVDPAKRPTAEGILRHLVGQEIRNGLVGEASADARTQEPSPGHRIVLPIFAVAAVLLVILIAGKFMGRQRSVPVSEASPQNSQSDNLSAKSSAASLPKATAEMGLARATALDRIMPDVSRNALHTIKGRIKVGVAVAVDASGNVSGARLVSPGPSKYFSSRSLAAARQWKFSPAKINGEPVASEWMLRFQFGRGSTQVFPTEMRP
jgi:TonB family protein